MNILRTVVVKQILTDHSKQQLFNKFTGNKLQLEKECDQLRFELKRIEKTKKIPPNRLKNHFEKEIHTRQEKIKLLEFQLEQLHILPIGSEMKEKEIQALVEIKVGDRWDHVMNGNTIIIKDGIVDEIR